MEQELLDPLLQIQFCDRAACREQFALLNRLAEDYYTTGKGNVDSSLCIRMLQIAEQLNSDSLLAIAYNLVGGYFVSGSGDYSRALEVYFKAVQIGRASCRERVCLAV